MEAIIDFLVTSGFSPAENLQNGRILFTHKDHNLRVYLSSEYILISSTIDEEYEVVQHQGRILSVEEVTMLLKIAYRSVDDPEQWTRSYEN